MPPRPPPSTPPPLPSMMAQSQSPPPPRGLVLDDAVTVTTSAGIGQPSLEKVDVGDVQTPAHVVVGADRVHWPGVIGVINSLLANSATPERLHVLALCPSGLEDNFTKYLQCHGLKPSRASDAKLRVAGFDPKRVPPLKVQTKLTNLESPLNFARFYLAELLPGVRKVLYLDADVIVAGDAVALLDGALPAGELCAATLRKTTLGTKGVASLKNEKLLARFLQRYGRALPLDQRGFNAGVFVFNLHSWRAFNLTHEAEHWIRANNQEKLYALGSQPPLTLAILGAGGGRGRCQPLPAEWHLDCLGCMGHGRIKTAEQLQTAKLFHWNGPNKPFKTGKGDRKRAYVELFAPYKGRGDNC